MKKLLLSSIIAMFAVPAFADTVTTLPNNAVCNETNLGTSSGAADIEVVWEPNTINTTWYSNGTQLSGNGVPATCTYNTPILPPTPAPRAGYVFGGWALRAPASPLLSLNASIAPTDASVINLDGTTQGSSAATYGLTQAGTAALHFSYGDIYVEASCNESYAGDIDENDARFQSLVDSAQQIEEQYNNGLITEAEMERQLDRLQILMVNILQVPSSTFSRSVTGPNCWCRVYGYKPSGGQMQTLNSSAWFSTIDKGSDGRNNSSCAQQCLYEACIDNFQRSSDWREMQYGQIEL